jgi:hypothetical protein
MQRGVQRFAVSLLIRRRFVGFAGVAVLSGCGASGGSLSPTPSHAASQQPAPTATPKPQAWVIAYFSGGLHFVRDDGSVLGSSATAAVIDEFATAIGRLWHIANDGHLRAIAPDGSETDLGLLQDVGTSGQNYITGLAVSPDGQSWAWGVTSPGSPGAAARTRIEVGGVGAPTRIAMSEAASPGGEPGLVLVPLAWTSRGLFVSRDQTGIGGCCYLWPETGGRDTMLVDPTTFAVVKTWSGCQTKFVSLAGSFACDGSPVVVHQATGADVEVAPIAPVAGLGWIVVDDVQDRVLFAVIHDRGAGAGDGPYVIDTEQANLASRAVSKLYDQATPLATLPDGRVVVAEAPAVPSSGQGYRLSIRSSSGSSAPLGPRDAQFIAAFPSTS